MNSRFVGSLLMLLLCGGVAVAEEPRKPTPYGVLYKQWKAEVQGLDEISPPITKQERRERRREINRGYTARFLKLAQDHREDGLWVDCLIWTVVEGVPGKDYDAMFDLLRDNAAAVGMGGSHRLMLLMSEFIPLDSERLNPALSKIAETHPSQSVRGTALYALAARITRQAERDGRREGCKKAERLLETVVSDYPDGATYHGKNIENATALLEELRSPVAITKDAPAITGRTLDDADFKLDDHRGQVVVLAFSGHWCGPCVAMHPTMKTLVEKYDSQQVTVVEINSDQEDRIESVRQKVKADSLNWIIVQDGSEGPISKSWYVSAWPTFVVLDAQHRIRRRDTGNMGLKLIDWVDELVENRGQSGGEKERSSFSSRPPRVAS